MVKGHNERCKDCKKHVFELLTNIFGEVKENHNLQLPSKSGSLMKSPYYSNLKDIYASLKDYRGYKNFIRSKNLPNIDYYILDYQLNLEFDESQHFTIPRKIALEKYPEELKLGFDRQKWINLCEELDKRDNDPPYRDEQRAWYDTLRDFAPTVLNHRPTIRLYAKDHIWCKLDPDKKEDQKKFIKFLKTKVYNYKSTIIKRNPEYTDKKLLLADNERSSLFQTNEGSHIQIHFNKLGNLIAHRITSPTKKIPLNWSLRKIGIEFIDLKDPTVEKMINYLVTPEMEIERIFNNLRYKYLKSIYLSELNNPQEYINAKYNNAFQSLAGINIYQGPVEIRKDNDDFWKEAGFKEPSKTYVNFETEKNELEFILKYIKNLKENNYGKIYRELIAIKPGFHELYIHSDYFDKETIPKDDTIRSEVFRLLRCFSDLKTSEVNKLDKMPPEINKKNYLTYASCNITEGPFVFRKSIETSYFDEIRKIKSKEDIKNLENNYYILDYYHRQIISALDLKEILNAAKEFRGFI